MDHLFLLKLSLSFLVGSVFITFCTIAAEKFGSKVGGLIGGLPSTVVVTLLFIGLVQTPEAASQATDVIPLVMGFSGLFLVTYTFLAQWGLWIGLGSALAVWSVLSLLTILLNIRHFGFSLLLYFGLLFLCYYLLEKRWRVSTYGSQKVRFTFFQIISRGLFSGAIIALAVYLSKACGPIIGGIFSVFPAVFTSTLIISYRSRGATFSRSLAKPLLISGMVNIVIYAIAVRYLYPISGIALGTLFALAMSGVSAYGTYTFIKIRLS